MTLNQSQKCVRRCVRIMAVVLVAACAQLMPTQSRAYSPEDAPHTAGGPNSKATKSELEAGPSHSLSVELLATVVKGLRPVELSAILDSRAGEVVQPRLLKLVERDRSNLALSAKEFERAAELCRANQSRLKAAQNQLEAVSVARRNRTVTIDLELDAQRRLTDAQKSLDMSTRQSMDIAQTHVHKHLQLQSLIDAFAARTRAAKAWEAAQTEDLGSEAVSQSLRQYTDAQRNADRAVQVYLLDSLID